jgi:hypothetical protein
MSRFVSPPRFARAAILLAMLAMTALIGAATVGAVGNTHAHPTAGQASRDAFRAEMRRLWEDHIVWTRQYIVSAATFDEDLPDIGPTADRLFANQVDIGNAIAPFYGEDAGAALAELLNDHIAIAADAIAKARAGDKPGLDAALERWYANADDISAFLAAANPNNWPYDEVRPHMRDHLDLTLDEAVARLNGDFEDDIAAYDAIHVQILHMADMLSDGIIAQFPGQFGR